jgi:hypothetical protein
MKTDKTQPKLPPNMTETPTIELPHPQNDPKTIKNPPETDESQSDAKNCPK